MISSLMGRARKCLGYMNLRRPSLLIFRKRFSTSLEMILFMGNVIHVLPHESFLNIPFLPLVNLSIPHLDDTVLISVPRNLALPTIVDVIRVFFSDNSKLIVLKKSRILVFSSWANHRGPQRPISQSSAYRT